MSEQERFDDLVRRKLEERSFPFAESDWQAAEQLILTARAQRRHRRFLPFAAAALLILGAGILYDVLPGGDRPDQVATTGPQGAVAPVPAPGAANGTTTPTTAAVDTVPAMTADPKEASTTVIADPIAAQVPLPTGTAGTSRQAEAAVHHTTTEAASVTTTTTPARTERPIPPRPAPSVLEGTKAAPMPASPAEAFTQEAGVAGSGSEAVGTTATSAGSTAAATEPEATSQQPQQGSQATTAAAPAVPASQERPISGHIDEVARMHSVTHTADTAGTLLVEGSVERTPQATGGDSTTVLTGDTAAAPPLVRPTSPWEVSVLAGLLQGRVRYGGDLRDRWDADVTDGTGWSAGAEVMHMGRNVGIGTGLHFSTYAERLTAQEQQRTEVDVERYYFLTPVDTTVTVSTGIVWVNGQPYQTITSVDTVINVLDVGYDTTTTVTVQRAARALVNRVSYLEVPLLVDAHLTQGRWQFGLRGGPTLGVLTGRRGALPDPAADGYADLSTLRFRSLVPGWTARAYIRYRWNSGWSISLEPLLRGQFGNGLEGDLKRSTMAYGAMVGLTYRLR